jgi:hypothetical protein
MQHLPAIHPTVVTSLARRAVSATTLHPALYYHRAAFSHAVQVAPLILGLGALFAAFDGLVALTVLVIAEVALVVLAPRSPRFRRSVDRRAARRQRFQAANARLALLSEMNPMHAKEFIEIERLAWETREKRAQVMSFLTTDDDDAVMVDRSLVIEKLLAAYLRLAIAQRNRRILFSPERRKELDLEVAALAIACASLPVAIASTGANDWAARRRAILELREATWKAAADDDRVISEAMATIASIVRWAHEVCSVPLFLQTSDDHQQLDVDQVLEGCLRPLMFAEDLPPYNVDTSFLEMPPPVMVPVVATMPVLAD